MAPEPVANLLATSANSAAQGFNGPTTFHFFPRLPVELQLMVWEFVPSTRRCFFVDRKGGTLNLKAVPSPDLAPKNQTILHICQLSRMVALKRFVVAHVIQRSSVALELSLHENASSSVTAPKVYIDPEYDLFDIIALTKIIWATKTLEIKRETAMAAKDCLARLLGANLPLQVIKHVVVGAPRNYAESFFSDELKSYQCKQFKEGIEIILPNVETMIITTATDYVLLGRAGRHYTAPPDFFDLRLLKAAQICQNLAFAGVDSEESFITPGAELYNTCVTKVDEGICYIVSTCIIGWEEHIK
ncbi:hypothetical protein V8F20_010684 [Naviculisporaceae sp. PSN 640]